MIEAMSELPEHLRRSITWDRGSEMAHWRDIELQLDIPGMQLVNSSGVGGRARLAVCPGFVFVVLGVVA